MDLNPNNPKNKHLGKKSNTILQKLKDEYNNCVSIKCKEGKKPDNFKYSDQEKNVNKCTEECYEVCGNIPKTNFIYQEKLESCLKECNYNKGETDASIDCKKWIIDSKKSNDNDSDDNESNDNESNDNESNDNESNDNESNDNESYYNESDYNKSNNNANKNHNIKNNNKTFNNDETHQAQIRLNKTSKNKCLENGCLIDSISVKNKDNTINWSVDCNKGCNILDNKCNISLCPTSTTKYNGECLDKDKMDPESIFKEYIHVEVPINKKLCNARKRCG